MSNEGTFVPSDKLQWWEDENPAFRNVAPESRANKDGENAISGVADDIAVEVRKILDELEPKGA